MAAQINSQLEVGIPSALSFEPISIPELQRRWLEHHEQVLRSSVMLFRNLDTGEYEPLLATGIEWIDNVTLEVELRDDVVFHDGSSFGAEDVVYTVNHVTNEDNGVLTIKNVSWMKDAEALGPHKVPRCSNDAPCATG